jgi:succinate dehydrogenase / fumarate reductase cytochrome b subunit
MGWLGKTINSSIGKKSVMAVTGLALALFIIAHLAGNTNAFRGRTAFEAYAGRLRDLGAWLYLMEFFLFSIFFLHIGFGLKLFWENLRGRPNPYAVSNSAGNQTWGSHTMPHTGLFLLLFLIQHLARFRFAVHDSVSDLVRESLSRPLTAVFYLAALTALTLHLGHGLWSLWQSLGLNHPKYAVFLERTAFGLSVFIGALFAMLPILAILRPDFLG